MASLFRHTAPRRYIRVVNGNATSTTRALSGSTRLRSPNTAAGGHVQEREAAHGVPIRTQPAGVPIRKQFASPIRKQFAVVPIRKQFAVVPIRKQFAVVPIRKQPARPDERFNAKLRRRVDGPEKPAAPRATPPIRDQFANARLQVPGPAGTHAFSTVFLRDLCSCPRCVDASTRQKLFVTADIPKQIEPIDVQFDAQSVSIKWRNDVPGYAADHVTVLPLALLTKYAPRGGNLPKQVSTPRVLWDAHMYQQTQDFTYEAYMEDDAVLLKALRQLQSHGLLFVSNVPGDEESVKRLSERIGPLKTTFYGETWDVRSVPQAKNVAYTSQNLGFHMDLMYMKQPPHLQLLHCIRSSSAGGASLFADSFKAAIDLCHNDLDAFTILSKIGVNYHYDHKTDYYYQARPVIEQRLLKGKGKYWYHQYLKTTNKATNKATNPSTDHKEAINFIDAVSWSPPFQAPFRLADQLEGSNKERGDNYLNNTVDTWHDAAGKFNELIHRPEAIFERLMQPGECVIFDNRRVLHARKAFEVGDEGKERWLRGAYIDKDPFISKLKILSERYGDADEAAAGKSEMVDADVEMQKEA